AEKPSSRRYFVWCTWTAYQAKRHVKYPTKIHQKRLVRTARASVHSVAAHRWSTTWTDADRVACPEAASPSARRPSSSGRRLGTARRDEDVQRQDHQRQEGGEGPAGASPADAADEALEPGQEHERAHADAREGDAEGEATLAHEPVRQQECMAHVAHEDARSREEEAP